MTPILILKTGALGDVLRTTSILPGLRARYPDARITWLTATAARDLVRTHPLVDEVVCVDPKRLEDQGAPLGAELEELAARGWKRVLSFDDEWGLCRLANAAVPQPAAGVLTGAHLDSHGERSYTPDSALWMGMGLLSKHGKDEADRLKKANEKSHPALFAEMLGIEMGEPELRLTEEARAYAEEFAGSTGLGRHRPVVGLNTGAGGRWHSKRLSVETTTAMVVAVQEALGGEGTFLVLGGPEEAERNAALVAALRQASVRVVDAGVENDLLEFAALVHRLDLLVTSDSLALHMAVSGRVPVVSFFAPTSAAEIELYGRGEKVVSTAPDYCSYRPDADTSTLTPERLSAAILRVLAEGESRG